LKFSFLYRSPTFFSYAAIIPYHAKFFNIIFYIIIIITKTNFDTELARITQIHAVLSEETSKLAEAKIKLSERKKLGKKVSSENTLERSLVDLFIKRIIIYPDNKIEIEWKIKNFFSDEIIE